MIGNSCLRTPDSTGDLVSIVESRSAAWTVEGLAKLLKTSTKFLYRQLKRGVPPAYRVDRLVRLDRAHTAAWLRQLELAAPERRSA